MTSTRPQKIGMFTLGTRGDVQPFVELAFRLEMQGHEVTFASPPEMGALTSALSTTAVEFGPNVSEFLNSPRGQRIILSGRTSTLVKELFALNNQYTAEVDATFRELSSGVDVVIGGSLSEEKAAAAALANSAALFSVHFSPFMKNSLVPHSLFDVRNLGKFGNRRTYDLFTVLRGAASLRDATRLTDIPLADRLSHRLTRRAGMTVVDAYSRHLLPGSAAGTRGLDPTGFIGLSPEVRELVSGDDESGAVLDWIESDPREVIYVGFGSMPVGDPNRLLHFITETCRALDVRAVWCTGWSSVDPADADERVLVVGEVDHDRVLPACAAVVHHGGAGTTAVVLRHGRPQVVMPFFWDQQFWGRMIADSVIGTQLRFGTANARTFEAAVRYALSPPVRHRAELYALAVASEDGTGGALAKITGLVAATPDA